jgi:hypothetical protein
MNRLFLAVAFTAIALAACGDDAYDGPGDSGIRGQALTGPQCPVVQQGSPCPDEPIEATVDVLSATGDRVTTFTTGDDGRFELKLPPGEYSLDPQPPDPDSPFPAGVQQTVTVEPGRYTEIIIQYDTGIR